MKATHGVTVIAEAGSCHDQSFAKALALVDAAVRAGADYVKFQYWSSAKRLAERRHAPELRAPYEQHRISHRWLPDLLAHCRLKGVGFACTSYLPEDVPAVARYAELLKVASFEASDPELLRAHVEPATLGTPVVVSLGLGASGAAVERYLRRPIATFRPDVVPEIVLMHCVSSYPTPLEQLHLARLWRPDYDFRGFSDHTPGDCVIAGGLAVAAGAVVVERHLRLDDTSPSNPDFGHAMTPAEFEDYVIMVRLAAQAMGAHLPSGAMPCESGMLKYAVEPPQ